MKMLKESKQSKNGERRMDLSEAFSDSTCYTHLLHHTYIHESEAKKQSKRSHQSDSALMSHYQSKVQLFLYIWSKDPIGFCGKETSFGILHQSN